MLSSEYAAGLSPLSRSEGRADSSPVCLRFTRQPPSLLPPKESAFASSAAATNITRQQYEAPQEKPRPFAHNSCVLGPLSEQFPALPSTGAPQAARSSVHRRCRPLLEGRNIVLLLSRAAPPHGLLHAQGPPPYRRPSCTGRPGKTSASGQQRRKTSPHS